MAPEDMFASSSSQNIPDSQGTVVSGVNLFSQCSVDVGKVTPGSKLQGSSITDQEIQEEAQDISEEIPFSGQSLVATEVEEDKVSK